MDTPKRLEITRISPAAVTEMTSFHSDVLKEVITTVERDPLVVVGMAQNPVVKKVRKALDAAGFKYTYLEYGSYLGEWKPRLAIKLWSGWPTFPQVFVRGELLGGADLTVKAIESGELKQKLGN